MKKKRIFEIILIVVLLIAIFFIYLTKNSNNNQDNNYSDLWLIYDNNVETIKKNMDIIGKSHEKLPWGGFKDTQEIPIYKDYLERLVRIVTDCYVDFAGLDEVYTDAGRILKYRDNIKGEEKDKNLYYESMCTSEFNLGNFSDYALENEIKSYSNIEKIIKEIREFDLKYGDTYKDKNFKDYLTYKVIETTYISKLTNALVIEYYNLGGKKE